MLKLQFAKGEHKGAELKSGRLTIGRDKQNNIVLAESGVSGFHAEIQIDGSHVHVIDLGSTNGTFVNGKRINGKHELKAWDTVRFDSLEAEIVDSAGRRPTMVNQAIPDAGPAAAGKTQVRPSVGSDKTQLVSQPVPKLVVISGPASGKSYVLEGESRSIGRADGNDIVLPDQTVSSKHAALRKVGAAWRIDDAGSSNGVMVNGSKVSSRELKAGDKIVLGKTEMRFELPGIAGDKKTQVIPNASGAQTMTMQQPAAPKRTISAWTYGLIAFLVVGLGAGGFFMLSGSGGGLGGTPKSVTAKLQGIPVWAQSLSDGRSDPGTPVLADINNDGFLDVIVGDAKGYVTALDGQKGLKIFETETVDRILAPAATGDLTGNGVADVVVVSRSGEVTALNGEGKILWKSSGDLALGAIVNRPAVIDVSGDGIADVIVPTESKGLVALDGSRGWKLWDTETLFKGAVVSSPVVGDINGDGLKDFIAVTSSGHVAAVTGQGGKAWQLWESQVSPVSYASPLLLDLKGNGKVVVIATDNDGIVALNASTGRLFWQAGGVGKCIASPIGVDADGDGVADVAVVTVDGSIHVLNGATGDTIWSQSLGAAVLASPAVFDCTNDGLGDLLILDGTGHLNVVDMARGQIVLRTAIPDSDAFVASPVLGDLTNDQMLEVVAASKNGKVSAFGLNRSLRKGSAPWAMFLGNETHSVK